jgi:hypothetical protein
MYITFVTLGEKKVGGNVEFDWLNLLNQKQ